MGSPINTSVGAMALVEYLNSPLVRSMYVIIGLFYVVMLYVIHDYIRKLERTGCECSTDWRRSYISWYVIIMGVVALVQILAMSFGHGLQYLSAFAAYGIVPLLMFIGTILMVVFSLQYVHRLKKEKCKCSEGTGRVVLQVLSWYYVVMWALQLIAALNVVGLIFLALKSKGKK